MDNNIGDARRNYAMTTDSGTFTQEDAAKYFGVSLSTYRKWEQGAGKLNGEILCQIADKYDTTVDYLLMYKPIPEQERKKVNYYYYITLDDEVELVESFRKMDKAKRAELLHFAEYLMEK